MLLQGIIQSLWSHRQRLVCGFWARICGKALQLSIEGWQVFGGASVLEEKFCGRGGLELGAKL